MTEPLPNDVLAAMDHRASNASPAPWEAFIGARDHTAGDDFIRIGGFDNAQPDMYVQHYLGATSVPLPAADLDFIAHARQDMPRLIAEIRRLRARGRRRTDSLTREAPRHNPQVLTISPARVNCSDAEGLARRSRRLLSVESPPSVPNHRLRWWLGENGSNCRPVSTQRSPPGALATPGCPR